MNECIVVAVAVVVVVVVVFVVRIFHTPITDQKPSRTTKHSMFVANKMFAASAMATTMTTSPLQTRSKLTMSGARRTMNSYFSSIQSVRFGSATND